MPQAGDQQLLHGEFGRSVEVQRPTPPVRGRQLGREGHEMRLKTGRDLQGRGVDLEKIALGKKAANGRDYAGTGFEMRPPRGEAVGSPPGNPITRHDRPRGGMSSSDG
jgi:hypothetical protein